MFYMRSTFVLFLTVLTFTLASIGCGSGVAPANSGNAAANNSNSTDPLATKTPAIEQTTNNAPTLTPVYKAYCEAMAKKDEKAVRKIYSSDTIKNFEEQMKDDKVTSLMKFLETDQVTGNICEVRNEQINGDSAVAEIRADSYPNGIKVVFVKENGEWKLTNKSPTLDPAKSTSTGSNASTSAPANAAADKKDAKK